MRPKSFDVRDVFIVLIPFSSNAVSMRKICRCEGRHAPPESALNKASPMPRCVVTEKNEFSGFMLGKNLRGRLFQSECVDSEGQNEEVLNDLTEARARLSKGFRPRG
jgi:hypothetical protein